jgi:ATP-binding cassette subfamily B protein/subfamily B ATP-binding cassette protein MsbA
MSLEIEEEQIQQKLFNKDVLLLLMRYILNYKKYLLCALFFVAIITTTTLLIPTVSRIIIDQVIIKQGYIIKTGNMTVPFPKEFRKSIDKKGIHLDNNHIFIYQTHLRILSKKQISQFTDIGAVSSSRYTLVNKSSYSSELQNKINSNVSKGYIRQFRNYYLYTDGNLLELTNYEMLQFRSSDLKKITHYTLLMLFLFSMQFLAAYLQILFLMKLSQRAMKDLRSDLYAHILSLEISFFDKNPVGKLVNRITNDIESLNEMFSSVVINFFQNILIMTGILIIMFITDWYLALLVSSTIPVLIIVTVLFRNQARAAYRTIRGYIADLNTFLNENISGIRIIQTFVQEQKQALKFKSLNNDLYKANINQLNIYAIFRPAMDFFRWFAIATVIYFGALSIIDNTISYGLIIMFLIYIGSFFEPIGDLAEKFDILQSATAAGEKILSVFKADAKKEDTLVQQTGTPKTRFRGEIIFDNVWFAYKPDEWVLKGVSFTIPPQTALAIVGESGSGKSTIISLLSKFYTIQKGTIYIDGINLDEIPIDTLRNNISIVMQDVFLFSRTIKQNCILNGVWNEERFQQISKLTNAYHFIDSLPQKEEQEVMERGVTFSAGERQLLAFTRALYSEPSILILDEATSNIDTHTEQLIQDAIQHVIQGRTTIAVAHRLSTIRNSNKIVVLDAGQIAESGTHDELVNKKGLYYDLYRLQFENT